MHCNSNFTSLQKILQVFKKFYIAFKKIFKPFITFIVASNRLNFIMCLIVVERAQGTAGTVSETNTESWQHLQANGQRSDKALIHTAGKTLHTIIHVMSDPFLMLCPSLPHRVTKLFKNYNRNWRVWNQRYYTTTCSLSLIPLSPLSPSFLPLPPFFRWSFVIWWLHNRRN